MSDRTEIDGLRVGLALLRPVRTIGPYEEHVARPATRPDLPPTLVARQPHPARTDAEALSERLEVASGRAQLVEHHLTLQCFGILQVDSAQVVQLLEWFPAVELEHVLRSSGPTLDPRAAVWLARQTLDVLAHAHALDVVHGALGPAHLLLGETGQLRVDFALSRGVAAPNPALTDDVDLRYVRAAREPSSPRALQPSRDVYAVAAILFELLTQQVVAELENPPDLAAERPDLPNRLIAAVHAGLSASGPSGLDARTFESMLSQAFYLDLQADDDADGPPRIVEWLIETRSAAELAHRSDTTTETPHPVGVTMEGHFTRALQARELPVHPQDYSPEDYITAAQRPESPPVELPTVAALVMAPPAPEYAPERATGSPTGAATGPFVEAHRPSALLWMLTGFAVTFAAILVWRTLS